MKRLFAIFLAFTLSALVLTGCKKNEEKPETKSYDLYIYNANGEIAAQFEAMCKAYEQETGLTLKRHSAGSGTDHMEKLRTEMSKQEIPSVFSIENVHQLKEWQDAGFVLDLNTVTDVNFKELNDAIPKNFRLTMADNANFGVPNGLSGYGYVVDTQMLSDLFGQTRLADVLSDLKVCTYDEFEAFVKAVAKYIETPSAEKVVLNQKEYSFTPAKTGLATKLTGVFAVMGAEPAVYGGNLVNIACNAVFENAPAAYTATDEQIDSLKNPFINCARTLDLVTLHFAGKETAGIRGADLVSGAHYGHSETVKIFADNKALFLQQINTVFQHIEKENKELASRLTFLPIKLPMKQDDIKAPGLSVENFTASIPVYPSGFFAINQKVSAEEQKKAADFLVWLHTSVTGLKYTKDEFKFIPYNADAATVTLENPLDNSILDYVKSDKMLGIPIAGAPQNWLNQAVGKKLEETYLVKEAWTSEDHAAIADFAVNQWKTLR